MIKKLQGALRPILRPLLVPIMRKLMDLSLTGGGSANLTFFLNLSSPTNATIGDGQGIGSITA